METQRLNALKCTLQALAQPAAFQHRLLSVWRDGVAELPERFVHAERGVVQNGCYAFTAAQRDALAALHSGLEPFCGPANAAHWQDDALDWSPHWAAVRELAARSLTAFG